VVDIIGRAKVIAETVVDEASAKKAGEKAGDEVAKGGKKGGEGFSGGFESIVGKSLPLAAVGVGAAVGTVLAAEIGKSLEREAVGARLGASLGLTGTETAQLSESAAKIYRESWGESFEAVQRGVAATKSSFRDLQGDELTEAARNAQIFADIFEVDVVEAAGVASVAVKQGLAKDAVEAFDLMTAAAQQVPIQFRGELLEAITEYSVFFEQIGIDGPEAFALLAEGAALGQYGIDKTGDAIKEFGIRAIDASTSTADAFKTLNLDIDATQTALAGGGVAGEEAFRKIVQGLDNIKDPAEQAQTAIALFGTPIEDLGNEQIPVFISALARSNRGLQNVKGSTKAAGDQATTLKTQLQSLARYLDGGLSKALSNAADGIANVYDAWIKLPARLRGNVTGDQDRGQRDDGPIPGLAGGGPARGLRLVGENGPELAQFGSSGGYVFNNSQTRALAASAGGDTINNNYIFNGPSSLSEARRLGDWDRQYGTRFGAATSAVAL
jgi:phage-related minor tail protein